MLNFPFFLSAYVPENTLGDMYLTGRHAIHLLLHGNIRLSFLYSLRKPRVNLLSFIICPVLSCFFCLGAYLTENTSNLVFRASVHGRMDAMYPVIR